MLEDDILFNGIKVKVGGMVIYVFYLMGCMEYNWGLDVVMFKFERWFKDGMF